MLTDKDLESLRPGGIETSGEFSPTDNEEEIKTAIEPIEQDALTMAEQLESFEIQDAEDAESVGEILKEVHEKMKDLEKKRKEVTTPLNKALKAVNAMFKPATKALGDVKTLLKNKSLAWYEEQEQARQDALDRGDVSEALATPEAAAPSTLATRKVWTFKVTDEGQVPRRFLCVDESIVKAEMALHGPENTVIPGIEVYQETKMVMGR
jgi:phage-related minor tail protein